MNDQLKDLIVGLGSMAEMASIIRDSWIKVGFTREEACHAAETFVMGLINAAIAQNKNKEDEK